jgi:hypothetical protein
MRRSQAYCFERGSGKGLVGGQGYPGGKRAWWVIGEPAGKAQPLPLPYHTVSRLNPMASSVTLCRL